MGKRQENCGTEPQSKGWFRSHTIVPDFDRARGCGEFAFDPCAVCIGYAKATVHCMTVVGRDIPKANQSKPEYLAILTVDGMTKALTGIT